MHLRNLHSPTLHIRDWSVAPGECWAVIGRNGSGKRLLAAALCGELEDMAGDYDLPAGRVRVLSFESQQAFYEEELRQDDSDFMDRLDPGSTVAEILGLETLPAALQFLGLERLMTRGYRLLSSGESRKLLLAQAILAQPDFLILDEPYDSLDTNSKKELDALFASIVAQGDIQLLFLLNTWEEVSTWHSHVAVMEQGRFVAQGLAGTLLDNPDIRSLLAFDAASLPDWPEPLSDNPLPSPLVHLRDGRVRYGDDTIFSGIDLHIEPGDHTLLTGRNGSGKSTLLSLISGDHPQCYGNDLQVLGFQRGSGESIWEVKKRMGIVSPELHRNHRVPGSLLDITVSGFFDSIGLYDSPEKWQIQHAMRWLALVGLENKQHRAFRQVSYGEQRLTLIARALAKQPALLLLDEPTQGLDEVNRHRVMYFLEHLSGQHRSTIVMASHRLDERLALFRYHLHLDDQSEAT